MSVVIETTLGDITVDLFLDQRPITCLNFLKLCKMKYYNFNLFHSIRSGFIAQTGDPSGEGSGGQSIWGLLNGPEKRFFSGEKMPKIRHTDAGLLSMVCTEEMMVGSQFFFTLGPDLDSLDGVHCVIGEVTEGHEILRKLNDVICDETHRPYQDVRITHTVVLEDPFSDPPGLRAPSRSPSPSAERLKGGRIAPDEELDEGQGKTAAELQEMIEEKEAKARATILEIVGDLPDADIAPPENVLFVCKLNPVTTDEDLEIIFSRFGKIVSCEVIRDKKSGDSLQYAFIEFDDKKSCEDAYFKMDNVLIDDRRIHVDFSQSVSKMRWLGKGRGVQHFNDDGSKVSDNKQDRSWRDDQRQYSRKDKDENRRHDDITEKNVSNKRTYRERSGSKSKTNYRHRDYHDSERQNSRKTDEYTKEKRDKKRDRSSSKTKSSFDKTEKSNDKKDRSRNRYEDNHRSKYEQTEVRNQNPSYYRNEQSESSKDDKYRSSREDDEARKQDRQSHKNEIKSRNDDQERSRNLVEKADGKNEYTSSKNYSEKLEKQSHKDRNRRDDISDGWRGDDENPRSRNRQQYKSDSMVVEKGHKSNSDDYHKDKQNRRVENEHKSRNEKERNNYENPSRNKQDEHSDYAAKENRYKNKDGTNKNEIISHKGREKDVNKSDSYDSKHDKHNKSRKERNYENELEHNKNNQQLHEPGNVKDTKSKKQHGHPDNENYEKELKERQERKERDRSDRHKGGDKNSHQTKEKRPTESSLSTETSKQDHSKDKEKHQKGKAKEEIKRKDAKKKVTDKKKASNKKENSKRKRKSSTTSDSDSDSSDSSSSSSSSSSSDSDHRRKKKRRKYSTSSSSSESSSSSSSDSSTSSTSSSDSDAKKKKIKKRRTKITKSKKK